MVIGIPMFNSIFNNGVEVEQMRSVRSTSGYCSQNSYSVHFGLNTGTEVDAIEIQWPSGLVETFTNTPSNEIYTVVEGENSLGIKDALELRFSVFPNPTTNLLFFNTPETFDTKNCSIHIYNLNGKFIKAAQLLALGTGVDVSQFQDGMYVYQIVKDQDKISSGAFVKN